MNTTAVAKTPTKNDSPNPISASVRGLRRRPKNRQMNNETTVSSKLTPRIPTIIHDCHEADVRCFAFPVVCRYQVSRIQEQ